MCRTTLAKIVHGLCPLVVWALRRSHARYSVLSAGAAATPHARWARCPGLLLPQVRSATSNLAPPRVRVPGVARPVPSIAVAAARTLSQEAVPGPITGVTITLGPQPLVAADLQLLHRAAEVPGASLRLRTGLPGRCPANIRMWMGTTAGILTIWALPFSFQGTELLSCILKPLTRRDW